MTPYPYQTKHGKRYRVPYRTLDKQQRTKGGFRTKREARAWYRRKMVEMENHGFSDNRKVTFADVAARWLENKQHTVAGSTYRKYLAEYRNHFKSAFGDRAIADITVNDCQLLTYRWAGKIKSFSKLVNDASSVFDLAIKYQFVHDNPFKRIERPRTHHHKKVRSFTVDEFNRFQRALTEYYQPRNYKAFAFLYLLSHTGLRKGELSALTWASVDIKRGFLHIKKAVTRDKNNRLVIGPTKNIYSVRDVPIGDQTIAVLKKWRLVQQQELKMVNVNSVRPNQLVFTSQKGGILTPSKPGKWLKTIEIKYDLPTYVTPHGLRHTYTSLLIDEDVPVNKVAAVLGHKDASITIQVYNDLHPVTDNSIGKVIEKV